MHPRIACAAHRMVRSCESGLCRMRDAFCFMTSSPYAIIIRHLGTYCRHSLPLSRGKCNRRCWTPKDRLQTKACMKDVLKEPCEALMGASTVSSMLCLSEASSAIPLPPDEHTYPVKILSPSPHGSGHRLTNLHTHFPSERVDLDGVDALDMLTWAPARRSVGRMHRRNQRTSLHIHTITYQRGRDAVSWVESTQ